MCGGTIPALAAIARGKGLSPRVRGNRSAPVRRPGLTRSIPACAGEPCLRSSVRPAYRVYPRVCGGTIGGDHIARILRGLSPRVRGNPTAGRRRRNSMGSIPACAGEPSAGSPSRAGAEVYPRVCGGTKSSGLRVGVRSGLSPRVRGNPGGAAAPYRRAGSIPACAGEPAPRPWRHRRGRVYPRVCGGTRSASSSAACSRGLSPRVRGNPSQNRRKQSGPGSIPACAGEPDPAFGSSRFGQVYPRVCGGTGNQLKVVHGGRGLSPRVRGNPDARPAGGYPLGSIPACAGEPAVRMR